MPQPTRSLVRAIALALALGLPAFGAEKLAAEKCCLWKVESEKATMYLLGSIHVGDARVYPLDPAIEAAFQESEVLVVEIDINKVDPAELTELVRRKGSYADGETLEQNLSKETLAKLEPFLRARAISLSQVNRQRPWLLSLALGMQEVAKLGYDPRLGVDKYFLDKAAQLGREILELETPAGQIEALASDSKEGQELFLLATLEEHADFKGLIESMFEAWKSGDAKRIRELVEKPAIDDPKLKPVIKKLFDDRNVEMTKKLERYLRSATTYFVVVGAGHLVGDKGIVNLLRAKGFEARQVDKAKRAPERKAVRPVGSEAGAG